MNLPIVIKFETGNTTRTHFRLVVPVPSRDSTPTKEPQVEVLRQNGMSEFYYHPISESTTPFPIERLLVLGLRSALAGGAGHHVGDPSWLEIDLGYVRG